MKGCILEAILEGKGDEQHCLTFVGSTLGVEIFLKKREHHKKGALKQRTEAPL